MNDQQRAAMQMALEALENNRQTHYYCEDNWYSCPKHEEGCANDAEGDECNCGADKANIEIDAAITALREALAQPSYDHAFEVVKAYQRGVKDAQTATPPSAEAAIAETKEKAAKVCEEYGNSVNNEWNKQLGVADDLVSTAEECAAAIRSMK